MFNLQLKKSLHRRWSWQIRAGSRENCWRRWATWTTSRGQSTPTETSLMRTIVNFCAFRWKNMKRKWLTTKNIIFILAISAAHKVIGYWGRSLWCWADRAAVRSRGIGRGRVDHIGQYPHTRYSRRSDFPNPSCPRRFHPSLKRVMWKLLLVAMERVQVVHWLALDTTCFLMWSVL